MQAQMSHSKSSHFLFPVAGQSGVCDTLRVSMAGAGFASPLRHTHLHTYTPVVTRDVVQILPSDP